MRERVCILNAYIRVSVCHESEQHKTHPCVAASLPRVSQDKCWFPLCTDTLALAFRKHESGWWEGTRLNSNARGWFPSNHVEILSRSNTPCTPSQSSRATPTPSAQQQQQQLSLASGSAVANKRLSSTSTASVASLSRRSTVLANEASGASSLGGTSVEGGPIPSEAGTPGTPDVCRLRDMTVAEVCVWLAGELVFPGGMGTILLLFCGASLLAHSRTGHAQTCHCEHLLAKMPQKSRHARAWHIYSCVRHLSPARC